MVHEAPDVRDLVESAVEAMGNAYAPYSDFSVGAAVQVRSGRIYSACNIEVKPSANILHAEQRAMAKAAEAGEEEFVGLALITSGDAVQPPCGNCMQTICSFDTELPIFVVSKYDEENMSEFSESWVEEYTADELLPEAYVTRG